ncbi:hypothetical protein Syun_012525 [Stephania yunnanensis]|uniref:Uncharacterized protein n=1 Tax=Stephania yunnanensis TaxID=152371 RepID=A0AAP0PJ21_9MAGN
MRAGRGASAGVRGEERHGSESTETSGSGSESGEESESGAERSVRAAQQRGE